jgi:adenosylhomocysteine nucleosidase
VVTAAPAERRALRSLGAPGVRIETTGMGTAAAARWAAGLGSSRPRALVAAGFCGALDPALRVGDLVAAEAVVDSATGERFGADPRLVAAAPGRRGTIVSAERIAGTPQARAALAPLGVAVDLESAALARAAATAGVPFLALRAVTDETRHRMPDLSSAIRPDGRLDPARSVRRLVGHPGEIPALLRLARAALRAGRSLREGVGSLLAAAP